MKVLEMMPLYYVELLPTNLKILKLEILDSCYGEVDMMVMQFLRVSICSMAQNKAAGL